MNVSGRRRRGLKVKLDAQEAGILRELAKEMRTLLEADIPRVDPVISRIFPNAFEDEADAESFRELVGEELRDGKLEALRAFEGSLGQAGALTALLSTEQAEAWLTTLTDMRLAIGTRLDVDEAKMSAVPDPADPETPALSVLHWLGWLQESMLEKMRI